MHKRRNEKLYDPEVGSLLMIVASALGALGGLAGIFAYAEHCMEKQERKRESERTKVRVIRETDTTLAEVRYSMSNIRGRINKLFEIINQADSERNTEVPYLHARMILGKRPLYLSEFQFRRYQMIQDDILHDISRFLRNVAILEQLMTEYAEVFKERFRYSTIRIDVQDIMNIVNDLLGSYSKRTYEDFISGVLHICERIEGISRWFADEL